MSRHILVPVEGGELRHLEISTDLLVNNLSTHVKDKKKLSWLLKTLAEKGIEETRDGGVKYKEHRLSDIKFNDMVISTCNNMFTEEFEEFYVILRRLGVEL